MPPVNRYFPLFIDLSKKKILVVGAGRIALGRIKKLLLFGPDLTVVAKEAIEELVDLSKRRDLSLCLSSYEEGFLEGKDMVLAATNDRELNHEIVLQCQARGILVNNATDRRDSQFYFPALALGEGLTYGLAGDGTDHAAVKRAAERLRDFVREEAEHESNRCGR